MPMYMCPSDSGDEVTCLAGDFSFMETFESVSSGRVAWRGVWGWELRVAWRLLCGVVFHNAGMD